MFFITFPISSDKSDRVSVIHIRDRVPAAFSQTWLQAEGSEP